MTIDELNKKYLKIPQELKDMKRWVCYSLKEKENGDLTKIPINAISGGNAMSNNKLTWTYFSTAIKGCIKYNCDGLGFMLGDGIFGIDLDNHPDENGEVMPQEEFNNLANEFVETLGSYAELSQSGAGVHIICKGKLPPGRRRKGNVESYDSGRFFVMTGNTILDVPIQNRENEIVPLWEKYVNVEEQKNEYSFSNYIPYNNANKVEIDLSDKDVLEKAYSSKNANSFIALMNGDTSSYNDDHSSADLALCTMLAFWTNKDFRQIDRIFRTSKLMRPKWDEMRGQDTYGNITIQKAINSVGQGYISYERLEPIIYKNEKNNITTIENATPSVMNIDEKGEPVFRIKTVFKKFAFNDTGNAERFYTYFGDLFKYNVTDKRFMFWTGKCWIADVKDIIKKYANKLIDVLEDEKKQLEADRKAAIANGDEEEEKKLKAIIDAADKNITRVSNKAGKEAMISEFKSLYNVPVESEEFNKDLFLLNTDSGIVDLKSGEILPFDSSYMQSKSTNVKISYEEPKLWIKFLHDIFYRGQGKEKEQDTQDIVDCIQLCLGYSLCGSIREQVMFLLYGGGSNGKSTFTNIVRKMMGMYSDSIASENLMQQKNNNSAIYSIAKLQGCRFLETGETEEGGRFAEAMIKRLTGGDLISAQFKYGNEFSFVPQFKLWMSTNNKPIIRGTDEGIWRRIFPFPFIRSFTEKEKDKDLPEKLEAELPMILGWAIKGFQKYYELGDIAIPKCLIPEKKEYRVKMDVISQFIEKNCTIIKGYNTKVSVLFKHYKEWAKDDSEFIMKASKVEEEMKKKGFETFTQNEEKYYRGIKLKVDKTTAYVFEDFDEDGD